MPRIVFTSALSRHLEVPATHASGATVGAALASVFRDNTRLRGYVLDDQGSLRPHIAVFLSGDLLARATALDARVQPDDEGLIMQALSGG